MPDPQRLLNTLRQATIAFRNAPGLHGRYLELPPEAEDVVVAGDLHGNLVNFKKLLDYADLARRPRRHFVVQELIHGATLYDEGGDQSHRLVDLVAALKCLHPTRVHYLLGNHELAQWTSQAITKNGADLNHIFMVGISTAYGDFADRIYQAYCDLFSALPVAIRLANRIFLSHSLPGIKRLGDWKLSQIQKEVFLKEDFLLGGAVHSLVWGRDLGADTVQRFLERVDADLLVTGHIPCDDGYQIPNPRQLIIDSKDEYGAAVLIPARAPLEHADLLAGLIRLGQLP
ncbi:MAG TPA: metallophosphoesterase [Gemmatales bacterium]|nr:metallophosphoesterase [Gemmatales bacterium]HMP60451.1 metallophosphoesterase [Gemmatales bacterium]